MEPILKFEDLIDVGSGFDDLIKDIDRLKKELVDAAKDIQKAYSNIKPDDIEGIQKLEKATNELLQQNKVLEKSEKSLQKAKKKTIDLTDEELVQREKEKVAQRERVKRAKQMAIIQKEEKDSIESLRAQLALATLNWKKLTSEELKNTKEGKALVAEKKRLTKQLKKAEEATDDHRRSVGKYNNALKGLRRTFLRLFVGRTIIDGLARLGGAFVDLFNDAKEGNEDFQKFSNTITGVVDRLKSIGITILNAVLPVIQAVIRRFQFFSEAISRATGEGTALGAVFDGVKWAIKGVINVILDLPFIFVGVKAAITAIGESMSAQFNIMSLDAEKLKLNIQNAFAALTGADTQAINKRLKEISKEIIDNNSKIIFNAGQLGKAYSDAANEAREEFDKFQKEQDILDAQLAASTKKREAGTASENKGLQEQNALLAEQEAILISISVSADARARAIVQLQKQITDSEIGSIEDRQMRLEALEEQRFKAEQDKRKANFSLLENQIQKQEQDILLLFGESSEELKLFRERTDADLFKLRDLNNTVETQQLTKHEQNKLNIKKEFADKGVSGEIEPEPIDEADELDAEISDAKVKRAIEANEKIKENNQQLLEQTAEVAQKVGDLIAETFKRQADLSKKAVDEQESNLSRARDRAAQGLESNIAFEKQELAKRQLEQQQREKQAQQAAKLTALFSLVAAAAASGDSNAVGTALAQFGILTGFEALLGFEEGGYTGSDGSNSTVKGLVHANEYVVTAQDTAKFGLVGKSGGDFGEAMGDYFDPHSPTLQNLYNRQRESFANATATKVVTDSNKEVVSAIQTLDKRIANQPNYSAELVKFKREVYGMIIKETRNQVTKITRERIKS